MKQSLTILLILFTTKLFAQNVGIGTTTPNVSAKLEIADTAKGILIPRMTAAQRTAISNPAQGLIVYQTDGVVGLYENRSAISFIPNWALLSEGQNYWAPAFSTNSIYNTNTAKIGVGTTNPIAKFHISSTDSALAILENTQTLATDINTDLFFKTGNTLNSYFTGAIKTTGTATNNARIGLYTGANTTAVNLIERLSILDNGNVGIGNTNPLMQLHVTNTDSAVALFENIQTLNTDVKNAIYFKTGSTNPYTGAIKTIGQSTNSARLALFTYSNSNANNLKERLSILDDGKVGIANINPTLAGFTVDNSIGAVNAMFGSNTTGVALESNFPSIAFNSYYNLGRKFINTGFGGVLGFNPTNGNLTFSSSLVSGTANAAVTTNDAFSVSSSGSTTIQGTNAGYIFKDRIDNTYGGWNWYANGGNAKLYRYTSGGDLLTVTNVGNVGIGTTAPTEKLTVQTATNSIGISHTDGTYKIGTYVGGVGAGGYFGTISNHPLYFMTNNGAAQAALLTDGRFCIGTTTPATGYLLNVYGKIISEEVRVQLNAAWPDYVFDKNYKKLSINELEKYVDENKHLPNIPSAKEIEKDGQMLGDVQRKMLEKIEELSLYLMEQNKRIIKLEEENAALKKIIK